MTLENILTNRNQLSEDILRDVKGTAASYGVTIHRADVKDLIFPGDLQEIMMPSPKSCPQGNAVGVP